MGGLSLRRRLPHRRTWIGGGWPSQTTWKGHLAPRMVAWPRQSENRQAVKAAPRLSTGNGAHPPRGSPSGQSAKQRVVARPDGITSVAQGYPIARDELHPRRTTRAPDAAKGLTFARASGLQRGCGRDRDTHVPRRRRRLGRAGLPFPRDRARPPEDRGAEGGAAPTHRRRAART
jgi:hypothetical protein